MNEQAEQPKIVIIGMGNARRGDDGVGLLVAEAIRKHAPEGVRVLMHEGDGADLLERWAGAAAVVVVDAMRSGASPGSVRRLDAHEASVAPDVFHYSSHVFGLAEGIETARAIGQLPPRLIVYGVEGAGFQMGDPCSPRVSAVVPSLADRILGEVAAWLRHPEEAARCTN